MNKILFPATPLLIAIALVASGCSGTPPESVEAPPTVEVEVPTAAEDSETTFVEGVLKTPEVEIAISDHRVIPVGEAGNEYGSVPVLAIWYEVTNLGTADRDINSSEFVFMFEAFQDTDPNFENSLNVGMLPDEAFLDSQTQNIKAGGTVPSAIAYELDDTTTPVELVAGRMGEEVGRMTFELV